MTQEILNHSTCIAALFLSNTGTELDGIYSECMWVDRSTRGLLEGDSLFFFGGFWKESFCIFESCFYFYFLSCSKA